MQRTLIGRVETFGSARATDEEITIEALDAKWLEMEQRFMPMADWSGLNDIRSGGWHRKLHIFQIPFYYIEYGMAQLGAVAVWKNFRKHWKVFSKI